MSGRGLPFLLVLALGVARLPAQAPAAQADLTPANSTLADAGQRVPTVGMEATLWVNIPGSLLEVVPLSDQAPVRMLILGTEPTAGATRYHLRYTGLAAETFDLSRYLRRVDGSTQPPIPPIRVAVAPLLPPGELLDIIVPHEPRDPNAASLGDWWYAVLVLWTLLCGLAMWWFRARPSIAPAPYRVHDTLAEIRPLAALAVDGQLTDEGRARLERLLIGYWQHQLGWADVAHAEVLRRIAAHAEAGPVLRVVQRWSHDPGGASRAEVAVVLQPFAEAWAADAGEAVS